MMSTGTPRTRRSLVELQNAYDKGKNDEELDPTEKARLMEPLETLMRAWKGIKELPPTSPDSLFAIGGYHGEPFRGAGWGNSSYWGGYCQHGNVLFPTWHRAYLFRIEEALRKVQGCADVTLPFWDETSTDSLEKGIPWALTDEKFKLDGEEIDNPLRSFKLPRGIVDHRHPIPDADYSKPKGYETVRYPLSGLVGTEQDKKDTKEHNDNYKDYEENVDLLNKNVKAWLNTETIDIKGVKIETSLHWKYKRCLDAPNYTVFSNTTSTQQWLDDEGENVMSLESPHNSIHLAIGGFDLPKHEPGKTHFSPIAGANGDMGENNTAGLDPIFFFHHCFVDRVFWLWQKKHHSMYKLSIKSEYPGTNTVDVQGPTPGMVPGNWLTLKTPLYPFKDEDGEFFNSDDVTNIERLGYTYGPGSLDDLVPDKPVKSAATVAAAPEPRLPERNVLVSGINRGRIRGSFLICAYATIEEKRHLIGYEAVLSRWNVEGCANCQTHLKPKAVFSLHGLSPEEVPDDKVDVEVHTRDGRYPGPVEAPYHLNPASAGMVVKPAANYAGTELLLNYTAGAISSRAAGTPAAAPAAVKAAIKRAQEAFQGLRVKTIRTGNPIFLFSVL